MDLSGYARATTNIAGVKAKGSSQVVVTLKTADSQFIASTLNGVIIVPKHIWQNVADPATFTNSEPGRLRSVHEDHALHRPGLHLRQEPPLLAGRQAAHPVHRVRACLVE